MLPRSARLTRSSGFSDAVRAGRRAGSRLLVVHLAPPAAAGRSTQVGLVVSRAVGPAVVRNQVKRRLRHLLRGRLSTLEPGSVLVVRALPDAAGATYTEIGTALDRGLIRTRDQAVSA